MKNPEDMTQDELRALAARVRFLLEGGNCKALDHGQLVLYAEIIRALQSEKVQGIPPDEGRSLTPRVRGFDYDAFVRGYVAVCAITEARLFLGSPAAVQQFFAVVVDAVVERIRSRRINHARIEASIADLEFALEFMQLSSGALNLVKRAHSRLLDVVPPKAPLSLKTVIAELVHADDALDASFPGYRRAGLHVLLAGQPRG